ncbi:MAG: RHS repeat-associated core domain-containing protein, partial [Myxococcales bacterium]|nr:RHS repeat-associated core domain-containing protein [Myxococcales bacterium]
GEPLAYDERFHLRERGPAGARVRYVYDSLDMLVRVEDGDTPWTAEYDAWGRRLRCGRGEAQTRFYWDGSRLAAEVAPDGRLRIYVYSGPEALQPIALVDYDHEGADPAQGRSYAVFYDAVGLPRAVEDAAGRVVWSARRCDAYGALEVDPAAEIELNLRWPGHYFDAQTGLHYNRYRYYCPRLGRYLQTDPSGQAGGVNVYAYPSNPLRDVDVLGLSKDCGSTKCGDGNGGKKPHDPHDSDLRKATKDKADELQGLPKKERPSVAAGMETPDGTITTAGAHKGPREGYDGLDGAPKTQAAYDEAGQKVTKPDNWDDSTHGPWPESHQSGKCGEAKNLADYEKQHGDLPPPGTKHDAAKVKSPDATTPGHGDPKPACPYCSYVQDQLGHESESGQSPYDVK